MVWQEDEAVQKVVCLAYRLNNLGSMFRLTLGIAVPLGISLSIQIERDLLSKLFKPDFKVFHYWDSLSEVVTQGLFLI